MKAYAYTIDLKKDPELISEYKSYHREIWPEVVEGLKKSGIISDRIFILGDRLFMLIEADDGFDLRRSLQNTAADEKEIEWDSLMRKFQVPVKEAGDGEWWARMESVFDLKEYISNH
jgi:L-rhamnose mutarotase